jgi:hypothetical protein
VVSPKQAHNRLELRTTAFFWYVRYEKTALVTVGYYNMDYPFVKSILNVRRRIYEMV